MVDQYSSLYDSFRWLVPTHFNIGQECCHRWANSSVDARRIALFYETQSGAREIWTYERLANTANQLANGLTRMGIKPGDRVALITAQRPEALVAHIACYSVGAVIVPFTPNTTTTVLEQRLRDAEARVAIFDDSAASLMLSKLSRYPTLKQLIGIDVQDDRVLHWRHLLLRQPSTFKSVVTRSSDPAILLYETVDVPPGSKTVSVQHYNKTTVTSLKPGIVLSHGSLIGSLPAFVASQNWFPHGGDVLWSPIEWFRSEGLLQALLPTLYFGQSFVATHEGYSTAKILDILQRYRVSSACLSSETLHSIKHHTPVFEPLPSLALRSLAVSGNAIAQETIDWCEHTLKVIPNQTFGSGEMGQVLGNSHLKWPVRAGSLGKPYPGHTLAVLDEAGQPVEVGMLGELAINRLDQHGHPDPGLFNGFWRQAAIKDEAFLGDWYRSGIFVRRDEDGYYWPAQRPDSGDPSKLSA